MSLLLELHDKTVLNEGVISKINDFRNKVKAITNTLAKYKYREYLSKNKKALDEITQSLFKEIVAGKKLSQEDFQARLSKAIKGDQQLNAVSISESIQLKEDLGDFIGKTLATLGALFTGFLSVLQGHGVLALIQKAAENPSTTNKLMVDGCTACLLVMVTTCIMCLVLRSHIGSNQKRREEYNNSK